MSPHALPARRASYAAKKAGFSERRRSRTGMDGWMVEVGKRVGGGGECFSLSLSLLSLSWGSQIVRDSDTFKGESAGRVEERLPGSEKKEGGEVGGVGTPFFLALSPPSHPRAGRPRPLPALCPPKAQTFSHARHGRGVAGSAEGREGVRPEAGKFFGLGAEKKKRHGNSKKEEKKKPTHPPGPARPAWPQSGRTASPRPTGARWPRARR